ncbi:hypothetical protein [Marinimicrococcus flavescens]|uniref:Uncharacterized protein n=1 Tax=Marinimicrococcus flavescens TaxID=3031815 RepID=A0AAP4D4Q5_9PROT|nr:hypothetical protein [Marinimicrococcus flavescens]
MRLRLAPSWAISPEDPRWPRFVNNHAWALVRLQKRGALRKLADGTYAPGASRAAPADISDPCLPVRDDAPLPAWARRLVLSASRTNALLSGAPAFPEVYRRALWHACGGRCAVTGLPFRETSVGQGAARRPFAPSLDRIDPTLPYALDNCRLVLQAVNFALNAFGDEVFLEIARAAVQDDAARTPPRRRKTRRTQPRALEL